MEAQPERAYLAIDMKSFYASVECHARGLDPLTAHLVVADESRTDKTICLAVSPALKRYGIPGRVRLFEAKQAVEQVNRDRLSKAIRQHRVMKRDGEYRLQGPTFDSRTADADPSMSVAMIVARPRMSLYMRVSDSIYSIYLRYIAAEDILVYSVDECFLDVTTYLRLYEMTPRQLAMTLVRQVKAQTGVTATVGVGTNLYLAKIAMDIVAKHMPADEDGVRIAELNERSYREQLWAHQPLTDFWRVGSGTARKLQAHQMYTMGDICRASVNDPSMPLNEHTLYKLFGVNAQLLIDHAWGVEPVTMADIKAYRPKAHSLSQGQVLPRPYTWQEARVIVCEMAQLLAMELCRQGKESALFTLWVCYDPASLQQDMRYEGEIVLDYYGRLCPAPVGGTRREKRPTSVAKGIIGLFTQLYDQLADDMLLVRRLNLSAAQLRDAGAMDGRGEQLDMFTDWQEAEAQRQLEQQEEQRQHALQHSILALQERFGRATVFRAQDLQEGATALQRSRQVGGHKE